MSLGETRTLLASMAAGVYVLGLIAVQACLMRFGIRELAAVDVTYISVGTIILLSLVPGGVCVYCTELIIHQRIQWRRDLYLIATAAGLVIGSIVLCVRFEPHASFLDLRAYPYPSPRLLGNVLWGNSCLIVIWMIAQLIARQSRLLDLARRAALVLLVVFVLGYTCVFGLTVYPAIVGSFGGGAPACVTFRTASKETHGLLLYSTDSGFYFYELPSIPPAYRGGDKLISAMNDPMDPLRTAITNNVVSFVPRNTVELLTLFPGSREEEIRKALGELLSPTRRR